MTARGPVEVVGLTYTLQRTLLDDVTVTFHPGELTALSGPSGSGKTTLLSIVGGLVKATAGEVTYAGEPTWRGTGDPAPEIAFVLQVYGLVPILSAQENVSVALRARGVPPVEADERALEALARFHIADLGDRQVEELSGGQMQRVACARGLVVGADVLLADEPTSELDEGNRSMVLDQLRAEAVRGSVVVVATHDPAVVAACDRHYALDEGCVVLAEQQGAERDVRAEPPAAPGEAVPDAEEPEVPSLPDRAEPPTQPSGLTPHATDHPEGSPFARPSPDRP